VLPSERVHPVDVPFAVAFNVFSKWVAVPVGSSAPCKCQSHLRPHRRRPVRPLVIYSRAPEFRKIWHGPEGVAESI
ncbi:MAG: hypothetical protein WA633_29410, partial [Stellaceae bacterium]